MKICKREYIVEYLEHEYVCEGDGFDEEYATEVDDSLFQEYFNAKLALIEAERLLMEKQRALSDSITAACQRARDRNLGTNPSRSVKRSFLLKFGWVEESFSTFSKDGLILKMHEAVNLELQSYPKT